MKIATQAILLLVLVCFVLVPVTSQEAIFAFAYNKDGNTVTLDSESSEYFTHKFEIANSVLQDLIEAKGTFNMPRPHLIMNNGEQKPAWIDLNKAQIVLEEKAYDICAKMGTDSLSALSLLLAHELIHYYEKHDWHNHFLHNYSNEIEGSIGEEPLSLEVQADQMGGFLSIMAGYNTSGVYENLLSVIYSDYGLNKLSETHAYPSLQDRISLARKASEELSKMNHIFDMSNQLSVIGEYELASDYLDYILLKCKFQSRELHNNKGILMAFSALPFFSKKEMPYAVPFEIDIDTRLSRKNVDIEKRNKYIDLAMQSFKTALILDEDYIPAQINLASLQILKEDYFEAEYLCRKSLKHLEGTAHTHQMASVYNNLAIIHALQDNDEKAKENIILSVKSHPNNINSYNKQIIYQEKIELNDSSAEKLDCKIDGVEIGSLYSKIMREEEFASIAIELDKSNCFYKIGKENSNIYVNFVDWGDNGYTFVQVGELIKIGEEEFRPGVSVMEIENILGKPDQILNASNMSIYNYKSHQVNLLVDDDGSVKEFAVYKNEN